MAYTQLASKLAYVGGNPNQQRKPYTPAQGQRQDNANKGVMAPMQPVNQPGVSTAPKPQAPKTYVVAPPMPQPQIPAPQAQNQQPAPQITSQSAITQPQGYQYPASFNPSMTQGQDWWRNIQGYQPQWNTTANSIKNAVSSLNPSMVPNFTAPNGYRDNLLAGINYLNDPSSYQAAPPPGTPPGTPPPAPLPTPKLGGASEFWPMELGGGTEGSRDPREAFNQWVELFGGEGNVKNEVKLGLLNMLMNQQDRTAALGDRDTAVNTLQGAFGQANNPLNQAIQQNALHGLQSAYDPRYGDLVLTGAREDANRRINQARTAMMDEFGDRGLGGSEVSGSMLNADIENRGIRDQALRELEIQLMEQQRGQQGQALQNALGAYGMGQDVDWRARQGIADLYAGTVRNPIDMSGLIGLHSALRRPIPEQESDDGGFDWGSLLGLGGSILTAPMTGGGSILGGLFGGLLRK